MPYRNLDSAKIIATAETLERRIGERFGDSSLRKVAGELILLAKDLSADAERLAKPIWWLRTLVALAVIAGAAVFWLVGTVLNFDRITTGGGFDFVQGVEAGLNTLVFAGIGVYTLISLEERIKRRQALDSLHGLRSVIHIIDMHQLTKDPGVLRKGFKPTASSPERKLTPADLMRYLDYCSELLSITGKVAALYAQSLNDSEVVGAVNDIENLGTNLSRKIWQKIMLIEKA